MPFLSSITTLLQTFAAFLIFVVGYLALLFCVFAIFLVMHLLYKGARLLRSHIHARVAPTREVPTRITASGGMAPHDIHVMSHQVATARRPAL
jgi:hypothetical protein